MLLIGCSETELPQPVAITEETQIEVLNIGLTDGAATLAGLVEVNRPNLILNFATSSDTVLLNDLDNDVLDAILIHHLPADRDDLWFNPIAVDGIAIVVHPENPIASLSLGEVRDIFGGDTLQPVVQERGSGVRVLFNSLVMGEQRVSINAEVRPNSTAILQSVAANPNAIGYVTVGTDRSTVKTVRIDNFPAEPVMLSSQNYPLSMPLYWVSKTEPTGELRGVLAGWQSERGQEEIGIVFGRIPR